MFPQKNQKKLQSCVFEDLNRPCLSLGGCMWPFIQKRYELSFIISEFMVNWALFKLFTANKQLNDNVYSLVNKRFTKTVGMLLRNVK